MSHGGAGCSVADFVGVSLAPLLYMQRLHTHPPPLPPAGEMTVTSPATAKNLIAVGATQTTGQGLGSVGSQYVVYEATVKRGDLNLLAFKVLQVGAGEHVSGMASGDASSLVGGAGARKQQQRKQQEGRHPVCRLAHHPSRAAGLVRRRAEHAGHHELPLGGC